MKKMTEIPEGYTRVTEILSVYTKLHLLDQEIVKKAADRGSKVHSYCESHALNLFLAEIDEDCKNYFDKFVNWFDNMVVELIHTEMRINSENHKISGAFDLLVRLRGDKGLTIVDIKTPATASKTWALQTAAYQMLYEEKFNEKIQRRICLMLPKYADKIKIMEYENFERDQELFLKALDLFRYFK